MRKTSPDDGALIVIAVVIAMIVGIVIAIYQWLAAHPTVVVLIGLGVLGTIGNAVWEKRERALALALAEHNAALAKASLNDAVLALSRALVAHHAAELTIRRKQLTTTLGYGLVDESEWLKEVEFFIDQIVEQRGGDVANSTERRPLIRQMTNIATADYASSRTAFSADMDPVAYEHMVADALTDLGWQTRLTKGSGDQGIDVIAEKREKRVVIQCKRYASAIGNAAVQEAFAGKSFENADYAAVVSNANFTRSARQLAKSTQVILLHHDELSQLQDHIFGVKAREHVAPHMLPAVAYIVAKASLGT